MTVLETERLRLRPFEPADAPALAEICAAREIAAGTMTIPHPYELEHAEHYIAEIENETEFAITLRADGTLVGSIALEVEPDQHRAQLGYIVGVPDWGHGYATEAGLAVLGHAFDELGLNRVYAFCFSRNPASRRVLEKLGMIQEGVRRGHTLKDGEYLDNEAYGILAADWRAARQEERAASPRTTSSRT